MLLEDQLAVSIAKNWLEWNSGRSQWLAEKEEIRRHLFAIDTSTTSNSSLPWKNKTTIPKLCQIRDNLTANYMLALFPKRRWLEWEPADRDSNERDKTEAIQNYMAWVVEQGAFRKELSRLILDYIDYGNAFCMPVWLDGSHEAKDTTGEIKVGYIGPSLRRINPLDIVFNPIAASFEQSPKIIRSLVSLGEVKEILSRMSTPEMEGQYQELFNYLKDLRSNAYTGAEQSQLGAYFNVDGFGSFAQYLQSDYCELLTFYGDVYDREKDEFLRNYIITVVDRHKVIAKEPSPSFFATPPIYHVGWRIRQDNLWAMGPLDNLVGMQYRIDHIENLKADVFDLITFPPLKVKGYVEDFDWGPFEKIYVGDDGDVEMMAPPFQVLTANQEITQLQSFMEEMAGAPKETLGFRSPGEKTAYEVQRLENAGSRLYVSKTNWFEENLVEPALNGMLELARRKMTATSVRVLDDDFKVTTFEDLTPDDITGVGRIRPIAARHFAERSETVQNLNAFFASPLGQDPEIKQHISSVRTAKLMEQLLDVEDYKIVDPYVRLSEQADSQRLVQSNQEQLQMESMTPSGIAHDDFTGPDLSSKVGAPGQLGKGFQGLPMPLHAAVTRSSPSPIDTTEDDAISVSAGIDLG